MAGEIQYSHMLYKGPTYALVIGISTYKNGKDVERDENGYFILEQLGEKQFPNLQYAADDARNFKEFLEKNGVIKYNVNPLIGEEATRKNIKDGLEKLIADIKISDPANPLVIIYFAGHGWPSEDGKHYLIPYDASRDNIRDTAISNKVFNDYFNEMETNRLIIFIDACYSGAFAVGGCREVGIQYDPKELGTGEGRFIIASCDKNQRSWEWDEEKCGIFSGHLLKLLRCETDDIKNEEVNLQELIPILKKKVKNTANELNKVQEPVDYSEGAKDIVIAYNKKIMEIRKEQKQKFLNAISKELEKYKLLMAEDIRLYFEKGVKLEGRKKFYDLLEASFDDWWKNPEGQPIGTICIRLSYVYDEPQEPRKSTDPFAQEQRQPDPEKKPDDNPADVAAVSKEDFKKTKVTNIQIFGGRRSKSPLPISASSTGDEEKRLLTKEDKDFILETIINDLDCYQGARELDYYLGRPLSRAEFSFKIHSIRHLYENKDSTKEKIHNIIDEIITRFQERWPGADIVETKSQLDMHMEKGSR